MRHGNHKYRLNMERTQRHTIIAGLAADFIGHGRIKTTITKCKALRIFVEKLITISKTDTVANRRLAYSKINNKAAVNTLFTKIGPKVATRNGGYTRIVRIAEPRVGDAAPMAYISLVD
jgi:large subunit ribosomal protein L17